MMKGLEKLGISRRQGLAGSHGFLQLHESLGSFITPTKRVFLQLISECLGYLNIALNKFMAIKETKESSQMF